jgi:hypothetical protein
MATTPIPFEGVSHGWSLGQPFRSCAHGLQPHPSRSPKLNRLDFQGFWDTTLADLDAALFFFLYHFPTLIDIPFDLAE